MQRSTIFFIIVMLYMFRPVSPPIIRSSRTVHTSSLMYSFKYNQQDAAVYNILYYCQCSTCFGRFLRPSSGAQELYTASGIGQACFLLPLALALAVAASKLDLYQMLCVQFLSSWWWAEKPPETCRALTIIKNIVYHCILLVVLKRIH